MLAGVHGTNDPSFPGGMQGLYQVNLSTTALAALLCADNPAIDQIQVAGIAQIPPTAELYDLLRDLWRGPDMPLNAKQATVGNRRE